MSESGILMLNNAAVLQSGVSPCEMGEMREELYKLMSVENLEAFPAS